uniref:SF3 helicase domain-containing protein n=1 Tax=viral metagenome TaxID=1070528 RepID=A0A6C0E1B5_9ZZZZ
MDNCGYIYCMSNPSFKQNIYKIGYTTNLPDIRQKQLNNTSIPELFTLEFAKFVDNAYNEEQIIHKLLAEYRINNNKEFFEVDISIIKTIFNAVEGKYYNDIVSIKTFNNEQFFNLSENLSIYDICKYIKLLAGKRFIYAYNKSEICLYCYDGKLWRCDDVLLKQYISTELFNFLKTISYGLYYEHKSYSVITNRIKKLKDADFKNKLVKTYREVNENLEIKFDFKWYLLGFTNKVYDLQEGIMRDYRYDDYMVSTTGYSWRDPTIDEIQVIKNIIKQIMPIDNERELFLQILCTALDGKNLEKICLFNAPGGNGKSLINDLLIHSLGNYAIVGNNAILFEPSKTTSNPEKSNIHKKRLVVFREPPESKKFENSILKELSGGGNYSSRTHYETESKKELNCTIIIECNKKPLFAEEPTNAETRRIIDLVFRTQYTDDISKINPDKHIYKANTYYKSYEFKEKYKFALIYILMKEYNKYKDNNFELVVPDIIKERTQQYLEKSFNIIEWFKENYVLTNNKNNICKMIDLYHEFSSSDFYINFTKAEKRRYNKSYFNNFITSHEFFKEYYCERNGNIRNCIIKWEKNT